ncbi:MAG: MucB/RseB C-terminal domain-containing protein [Bermanella sp.]
MLLRMLSKVGLICGGLSLLFVSSLALANQSLTAQGWYEQMLARAPQASYEGIFVHQAGNQLQTVEIVHGLKGGEIWERLLHLDGPTQEVIRRGDELYCIHPDATVEQLQQRGGSPFGNKIMGASRQLTKAYEFRLLGKQRFAGRLVMGVQLVPKDGARHAYQLWIDQQTSVPLRTELLTIKGQILERYQFSYFHVQSEFVEQRFAPRTQGVKLAMASRADVLKTRNTDVLAWRLNWLPLGFVDQTASGHTPKLSARRIYSDGLVMFSVYVESVDKIQDEGTMQAGPTALTVQHKQWQGQTHRITVVGEVPPAMVARIAQSVELL